MVPLLAYQAARKAGLPYPIACALLEQESYGGKNVYGSDPTIFVGHGEVTQCNYEAYVKERKRTGKAQGVGPCQLTYYAYQDKADAGGGCWWPLANMVVGFGIIAGYLDSGLTLHEAFVRYNGAEAYADQMDSRVAKWRALLK